MVMIPKISKIADLKENCSTTIIFDSVEQFHFSGFTQAEKDFVNRKLVKNNYCVVNKYPNLFFFFKTKTEKEHYQEMEAARVAGSKFYDNLKDDKIETVQIADLSKAEFGLAFIEGLLLSC